jgi:hypothetical protein
MIWLRRILAIPLIILFVLTFVLGLVLCHVSGTVGSAGFYNSQMRQAHVYDWVYDDLAPAALDEAAAESDTDFPFDTPQFRKEVIGVAEQTFPRKWLQGTFENATRQIVPYVVGDKKSFTITIAVKERIDPMAEGVKTLADSHKQEINDYMAEDLVAPAVTDRLGTNTTLSYGVTISDAEVNTVIKDAMLKDDWAIAQFKGMVDVLAHYLKGESTSLSLTVNLGSVKAAAAASLSTLADTKLKAAFDSLPATCTEAQFLAQVNSLPSGTLTACRPSSVAYDYDDF